MPQQTQICSLVSRNSLKCGIGLQRAGSLRLLWRSLCAEHFIWLWVLCNLRQHDWCSTFMRGILTAPLQRSMRTQLCVWAGNLEFMSPWQQNPRSCIMDYHWNSTPLPNIMRARDLIKSAHSVWHKVKKELPLCGGWGWERQAGAGSGWPLELWRPQQLQGPPPDRWLPYTPVNI